ncbi:putative mediator of RNA polymerase II transcription subunit 30 [Mercenaria mercenaria]|uniref:putative mediator of RNA polymerase II transcription subunit 30 n=1 Tax=Mercenaria mercenaria TaxID=6596 RepID=UPI00234E37FD|nr:putative mediator of RNA polymerase II transcription subunit 30 [Mercenaria mercenaria]
MCIIFATATAESNITVSCPPTTQQYCQQTTTSTTTSTTTVTTITMTTMNMTTTTETKSSSSTTTSNEPPTTPTTAAKNETTAAGVTSSDQKDNNLLAAVIGLGVLVVLLLIVIVVLSCCLYPRCCTKTKDDVEKVAVDNKQSPPPHDLTQTMRPDLKQPDCSPTSEIVVPVNAVDFGCQVQIDQVYTKEGLMEQVIIQKAENATTKRMETTIEHAETGCQVNLFPPEIKADKSKTDEGADRLPQIQLIDKETLTLSISQSDRQTVSDRCSTKEK